ncbi:hypothetical protein AAMO2058_000503000 [Amorphochlora amoebiformis]
MGVLTMVVASASGWFIVYLAISPLLSLLLVPETYFKVKNRAEESPKYLGELVVTGYSDTWEVTLAVTCGFFIWDTILHLAYVKTLGNLMLIHAFLGLITYLICAASPEAPMAWHACSMLLFEASTPLMIIRWFLIKRQSSAASIQLATCKLTSVIDASHVSFEYILDVSHIEKNVSVKSNKS